MAALAAAATAAFPSANPPPVPPARPVPAGRPDPSFSEPLRPKPGPEDGSMSPWQVCGDSQTETRPAVRD